MAWIRKTEKLDLGHLQRKIITIKDKIWNLEIKTKAWKGQSSKVKLNTKRANWITSKRQRR